MPSLLRSIIPALVAALLIPIASADTYAQRGSASVGAFASRHGLGVEAAGGLGPVSLFGRAEGFDTRILSAGLRARLMMSGGSVYAAGVIGTGRCRRVETSGVATGCDGEWHGLAGAALGLELNVGRRFSLFLDGGNLSALDSSADIPSWTFAAGLRLHLIPR
jgi:hypothetical protein